MCGICGIVGPAASQLEAQTIVRVMMDTLAHRGPDDEGMVSSDGFIFGHKRLAIIDLEHGKQPMQTEDGQITLIYNGEIYNYLELRQKLIREGAKFRTFSDTEVLLRLYETYGSDCVNHLNGMFAFALYDNREHRLFAARDHFGIKPFYYVQLDDGNFVFASEIKALFKHPIIQPQLDHSSLNQYLTFQFCLGEKTLFQGIQKLEPGHVLTKKEDQKTIKITKYWDLDYEIDTYHTEEYFIDQLQFLLQDSIRGQLRSDVPLGAYLSGGLDSSTVVSLASTHYGNGFKCFTGKFTEGPEYDESWYARIVAKENQCEYFEIIPTASDFIELLPKLIYFMDEPAAGPGMFPQYLVSKFAREHVAVVLGGQGGDEIFGGYARYVIAYLEQCLKGSIFETQEEGRHVVTLDTIIPNLSLLKQYVPALKSFWREGLFEPMDARYFNLIDRGRYLSRILHPDFWTNYSRDEIFVEFQSIFNDPQTQSYFNKMTHFDQKTLLPALLQVEDRVSMAVSLESRVPLLDTRIVDLVTKMPPAVKFKGGITKYSLRTAVQNMLPGEILDRKDKMGFPVPLKEWVNGHAREFLADTLLSRRSKERGLFRVGALDDIIGKEGKYDRQIWGVLCLELWFQAFGTEM